jgi:hypothetical protein
MFEIATLGQLSEGKSRLLPCRSGLDNRQVQGHELAEWKLFWMRLEPTELAAARLPGRLGKINLEVMSGKLQQRFGRGRKLPGHSFNVC